MARRSACARPLLVLAWMVPTVLGLFAEGPFETAARAATPNCSNCESARWRIVETANFRFYNYDTRPVSPETTAACERMRDELARQWLADADPNAWSPKCHIVLHPTDESYLREVGSGGGSTLASALVNRQRGQISLRRIDVRATRSDWQSAALAHELAHVVLADRFADQALPRWLDEGMAILADPHEKRQRHVRELKRAVARGAQFRVAELLALTDYPPAERWGTFYGQSASLVAYLVEQQGHERFVEFVELALADGYERALRQIYDLGVGELERQWHAQLTAPLVSLASSSP